MNLEPLPPEVDDLLRRLTASPRLVAHLTLVHDVACTLTARLDAAWPSSGLRPHGCANGGSHPRYRQDRPS